MKLKKHSIGYNIVTSTNGVITAMGVKSKPNSIEVSGYTHEVGEGEKSPDNPYALVSLDSGNMNLCNNWNYTSNLFTIIGNRITVQKASNTIQYAISSFKEFTYDKTKLYIYFKYSGSFTAGAKIPVCSIKLYTVKKKELYYIMISDKYAINRFNKCIEINLSSIDINSIAYYSLTIEGLTYDGSADYDFTIDVLMCENYISSYFEDGHSIVLSNNSMSIQIPIPVTLNSVEDANDYIFKDKSGVWKLTQMCKKYEFTGDETIALQSTNSFNLANFLYHVDDAVYLQNFLLCNMLKRQLTNIANTYEEGFLRTRNSSTMSKYLYLRVKTERASNVEEFKSFLEGKYANGTPLTIIYQLETPITHVLSDYTQELLNSFELQNQNNIFIEGYPDIKISGYLQKR